MSVPRQSYIGCRRPLVRILGDTAYCNFCGAERNQPCRLELVLEDEDLDNGAGPVSDSR